MARPSNATAETWAEADRLVDELFEQYPDNSDRLYLLARLAQEWGEKVVAHG